jgi:hypothetical protein
MNPSPLPTIATAALLDKAAVAAAPWLELFDLR